MTLSADLAKSNAFFDLYIKTQCILNIKSIFKGNVAIVKWRIMENILAKNAFLRKKLNTRRKNVAIFFLNIWKMSTKMCPRNSNFLCENELPNLMRFEPFYHKIQCIMNISFGYGLGWEGEEVEGGKSRLRNETNNSSLSLSRTSAGIV